VFADEPVFADKPELAVAPELAVDPEFICDAPRPDVRLVVVAGEFGAALMPERLLPHPHIQNQGKTLGRWCVTVLWFDWFAVVLPGIGSQTVSFGGSPGLAGVLQLVGFAKVGFLAESHPKLATAGRKSVRATLVLRFM
jgi:hypothetical protein